MATTFTWHISQLERETSDGWLKDKLTAEKVADVEAALQEAMARIEQLEARIEAAGI